MLTLLDRADSARVVLDPFPHIVVENALPEREYEALCTAFPSLDALPQHLASANNKRFNLFASWGPTELPSGDVPDVWRQFLDAHSSADFSRKVFDLFPMATRAGENGQRWVRTDALGEGLAELLPLSGPVRDDEILSRTTVGINTPCNAATSVRGPHVDSRWKAYVGLYYLRDAADDSSGGDLTLYRWKDGVRPEQWPMKADSNLVEAFRTIPYAPNTYVLMLNTDNSLHGVTVRQPTRFVRKFAVTSGFFPGVDEKGLLGRRKGMIEQLKDVLRPLVAPKKVDEYQD
jgi:hypothetical protein